MTRQYARSGDLHLAYRVTGTGSVDLLCAPPMFVSFDSLDENPHTARFNRRLSSFTRLIEYDPRGTGLSDASPDDYTIDALAGDVLAVLDAAHSERTVLVGVAGMAMVLLAFAHAHPDRVESLVLINGYATMLQQDDYPIGFPEHLVAAFIADNTDPDATWEIDGLDDAALIMPSLRDDVRFMEWIGRAGARGATPTGARRWLQATSYSDVRHLLPEVTAPVLVLHRTDNLLVPPDHGVYLAERLPNAKYVELAGADHVPFAGDADALLDEIEEFVTGRRSGSADRVLTTLLFTDIVDSTAQLASLGDSEWRARLDLHDALVRTQIDRFGGREVNTTGDGFVAAFASPTQAVRCATAIALSATAAEIGVRLGVHTGECEQRGDDFAGLTVHLAARIAALAGPGEVLASRTVCDLVAGTDLRFVARGEHQLKGVARPWELFAVEA